MTFNFNHSKSYIQKNVSRKKQSIVQYCKQQVIIIILPAWSDQDTVLHKTIIKSQIRISNKLNGATDRNSHKFPNWGTRHLIQQTLLECLYTDWQNKNKNRAKTRRKKTLRPHQQTQSTYTNPIIININILEYLYTILCILYVCLG